MVELPFWGDAQKKPWGKGDLGSRDLNKWGLRCVRAGGKSGSGPGCRSRGLRCGLVWKQGEGERDQSRAEERGEGGDEFGDSQGLLSLLSSFPSHLLALLLHQQ